MPTIKNQPFKNPSDKELEQPIYRSVAMPTIKAKKLSKDTLLAGSVIAFWLSALALSASVGNLFMRELVLTGLIVLMTVGHKLFSTN